RTDARKAADVGTRPEEDRVRHSDARLVPRAAAGSADGDAPAGDRGGDRDIRYECGPRSDPRSYGEADQYRVSLMGPVVAFPVDEEMEGGGYSAGRVASTDAGAGVRYQVIVLLVASLIFLGCIISPPSLMDDVDAVQAQIARNILQSGDWVTARLD